MEGRWIPSKMGEQEFKKGIGKIISKIRNILSEKNIPIVNRIGDSGGLIGFEIANHIVVGKDYVYGYIVSAHNKVVEIAEEKNKKLLMYIDKTSNFYEFDSSELLKKGSLNKRGDIVMLNWDIKLGKRFEFK